MDETKSERIKRVMRQCGVATAASIIHESNFVACNELQTVIGADKIVRINIDGVCALRIRIGPDTAIVLDDPLNLTNRT